MATAIITAPATLRAPRVYTTTAEIEEALLAALDEPAVTLTDEEWLSGDIMAIARERLEKQK